MTRMMLADDEPLITQGIQMLVDWQSLGVTITGVYSNGQEALQGILNDPPEVAVLDISMPGKSGIEIIEELSAVGCKTRVIFLSGFGEFQYAQAALRYGASDYLLKPVKKESLITAVQRCIYATREIPGGPKKSAVISSFLPKECAASLGALPGISCSLAAAKVLSAHPQSDMQQQLSLFSALGLVQEYLKAHSLGVAFLRGSTLWLALSLSEGVNPKELLSELLKSIGEGCSLGISLGQPCDCLRKLAGEAERCEALLGFLYFREYLPLPLIVAGEALFSKEYTPEMLKSARDNIVTGVFEQDSGGIGALVDAYLYAACVISGGKSDTTIYYLLSCIRAVEERFESLDMPLGYSLIVDTMDKARQTTDYSQMQAIFKEVIGGYFDKVSAVMQNNEKKDILKAKSYIEEHYAENLTLEILSGHIHMSSFYFSSFFKKQTGENFKNYLNKIRMKHCMELLVLTDKKSYEIAEEVGFRDYRYFTELFCRHYGKTPAAYRKELLEQLQSKGD